MQGILFERNKTAAMKAARKEILNLFDEHSDKYIMEYIKNKNYEEAKDIKTYLLQFITQNELDVFIAKSYNPKQTENLPNFYEGITESELFRLFVDVRKQRKEKENGFVGYEEREPGCLQAMFNAFQYIQKTMNEPLSVDYIKNIHKLAATKCPDITHIRGFDVIYSSVQPGEFKDNDGASIGMSNSSLSPLGFLEMYQNFKNIYLSGGYDSKPILKLEPFQKSKEAYTQEINTFIKEYEQEVSDPSPLNKLLAMVRLFQRLDRQHAFRDGNTRTYETLLLNRELIKHGFPPALLEDPGRFIGHTLYESVYELLRGIQNFRELKETGHIEGCIPTEQILKNNRQPITVKPKGSH